MDILTKALDDMPINRASIAQLESHQFLAESNSAPKSDSCPVQISQELRSLMNKSYSGKYLLKIMHIGRKGRTRTDGNLESSSMMDSISSFECFNKKLFGGNGFGTMSSLGKDLQKFNQNLKSTHYFEYFIPIDRTSKFLKKQETEVFDTSKPQVTPGTGSTSCHYKTSTVIPKVYPISHDPEPSLPSVPLKNTSKKKELRFKKQLTLQPSIIVEPAQPLPQRLIPIKLKILKQSKEAQQKLLEIQFQYDIDQDTPRGVCLEMRSELGQMISEGDLERVSCEIEKIVERVNLIT